MIHQLLIHMERIRRQNHTHDECDRMRKVLKTMTSHHHHGDRGIMKKVTGVKRIAQLIAPSDEGLKLCGERLRDGKLVAFPTETVYGLGANALNRDAVLSIFKTKGRPLTDPVIVHVSKPNDAHKFVSFEKQSGKDAFSRLATTFWPGPLTIVARARECLPSEVSAGTGFVGVRCPAHPIARRLLEAARVPVAAPSANRFGHVSPTSSSHVLEDLGHAPITVVAEGEEDEIKKKAVTVCEVGIESTVAKIDETKREIVIFRRGGVPEAAIRSALIELSYEVRVLTKTAAMDTDEGQQAPGQMITHYAPDVPASIAHLIPRSSYRTNSSSSIEDRAKKRHSISLQDDEKEYGKTVVVDCGGTLSCLEKFALAYRDISPSGNMSEAANAIFGALRWAEAVPNAERVLLADVSSMKGDHRDAVKDRMFRAASATTVNVPIPEDVDDDHISTKDESTTSSSSS